jgi:hypothetical protein
MAAYLVGRDDDSADVRQRAYHALLRRGDVTRAVRCAFWLAFVLLNRGELAKGGGSLARARRLLDDDQRDWRGSTAPLAAGRHVSGGGAGVMPGDQVAVPAQHGFWVDDIVGTRRAARE